MTLPPPGQPTDSDGGLMAAPWRPITVGMLALISILAFEHLAVATVMPVVARALGGLDLYAAAFGVAMATGIVGMVLAGRWTDRAGPRPALWAGVAAFVLGVLTVGLAPSMPVLVMGRALQGAGSGMTSVALYVLVAQAYPPRLHPKIFAAFAGAWVVPVIVGPALAGFTAAQFGWRWVFLAAIALTLPAALLLRQGLKRLHWQAAPAAAPGERATMPGLPLALAVAACAGLLYARAPAAAASQGLGSLAALAGLVLLAPRLLPRGTFRGRRGLPAVVALRGLAASAFFCCEVLIPLLLVNERGLSPLQAGLVLTVGALGWSAGSWLQSRRAPQGAARVRLIRLGMLAVGAGGLSVPLLLLPAVPLGVAVVGWTAAGLGIGLVFPMLSVLTFECAAPAQQGSASAALQLSDSLFSAVALALASALPLLLPPEQVATGYLSGFGVAAVLALTGAALASRARPVA